VPEWAGVAKAYLQRARRGKASGLFIGGRKVDPARVAKQLARYQAQISRIDGGGDGGRECNLASPTVWGAFQRDAVFVR
jgi:hypothetical protein